MSANFPTSLEDGSNLPNPTAGQFQNSPDHASLHSNAQDAIKAVEAKLGIGATTPTANTLLLGTGTGTSAWSAATSAQIAASVSDETGSGSLVFATSPTLVTPKADTINEVTPANGVTIDSLNIKDGKLNTNDSVVTANITNASVTANKLATGAAYHAAPVDQTTTSASYADLATVGPTVTVTIGANGLALATWSAGVYTTAAVKLVGCAVSGASTVAASDTECIRKDDAAFTTSQTFSKLFTGLTPGSTTFTMKYKTSSGTGNFFNRALTVVPL